MKNKDYIAGVQEAASIADNYNSSTTHLFRLGDCILGKLNLRKGKPRRNQKAIKTSKQSFAAGMALALAEINRKFDRPSMVLEVAKEAKLSLKELRAAGVDAYDLKELRKAGLR
jgi:hypothetical protein